MKQPRNTKPSQHRFGFRDVKRHIRSGCVNRNHDRSKHRAILYKGPVRGGVNRNWSGLLRSGLAGVCEKTARSLLLERRCSLAQRRTPKEISTDYC